MFKGNKKVGLAHKGIPHVGTIVVTPVWSFGF